MAYRRSSQAQQTSGTPQDRVRADPVPEPEELTLDAAVAPRRILPGYLLDQLADLLRDGRPSGGVRVVHLFLIRRLCQASRVPGVTIRRSRRCLGRSRARAAIMAPVSPVRLRAGDLAAQDRYFVPQHQDLHVFRRVATDKHYQQGKQT